MSTTKDYEECFIMYSTMNFIKKTLHNKDKQNKSKIERLFEIHCVVKNLKSVMIHFEVGIPIFSKMKTLIYVPQMI